MQAEQVTLTKLRKAKKAIEKEMAELEGHVASLKEDLSEALQELEDKTKALDDVKKANSKATRALDAVLKDIATMVRLTRQTHCLMCQLPITERRNRETRYRKIPYIPKVQARGDRPTP